MRKTWPWFLVICLFTGLTAALTACGPTPEAGTESQSPINTPAADGPAEERADVVDKPSVPDEAKEITDLVQQDLAEQLNISKEKIQVVRVTAVEWHDSSLGCPKPGMAYLDVITPGYQIVLRADGQEYTYHTGSDSFVLCMPEKDEGRANEDDRSATETGTDNKTAALVAVAKKDLSKRLNVAVEDITLQSAKAVEWRDSSLGCPKPGMGYLMVITPGHLIILEVDGQVYEYHAGSDSPFYCENPEPPLTSTGDSEERALNAAKTDLAQSLNITADQIQVVKVEAVEWPDASLGCPKPGMMYAQVVTPGYHIILSVGGQEYDYRANLETAFLCEE